MANPDGAPIWYELLTTDADAAQAFYTEIVGWSIAPAGIGGSDAIGDYRILTAPDGQTVGGLAALPPGVPMPPRWLPYFGVADVDATAKAVTAQGGAIRMPPTDIPGVGRLALATDPQGLPFYIMRGDSPESSRAFDPAAVGHAAWNELVTSDHAAALRFYGALFGWRSDEAMPMGKWATTASSITAMPASAPP